MKVLYLGYICEQTLFELLSKNDTDISVASHKYELCLLKEFSNINNTNGFTEEINVEIISYLPINSICKDNCSKELFGFPIKYVNCERNKISDVLLCIGHTRKLIKKWLHRTAGENRIILTYATNPVLLGALFSIWRHPPVITICSEVPNLRIMTNGSKLINMAKRTVFNLFNDNMNGYIFMSRHMNTLCNKKNRPWIVVEGMTEIKDMRTEQKPYIPSKSYSVFYAGGLFEEYGIDVLLECAALPENADVQFILCGDGNARSLVEEYTQRHKNIQYLGFKNNEEVMEIERSATLLINPRKPDKQLSRYSFPSKIFEYFASGTPCIITRLDGIPEEYYEYCYTCDVTEASTLSQSIRKVLNIPDIDRKQTGEGALRFIKEEKSSKSQANRIAVFLREMTLK